MLRNMKTRMIRLLDCLKVSSFLSHNALSIKPKAKKAVAVIKSAIVAEDSLKINERIIGIIVNIPVICIINPIFDKTAFMTKN